MTPRPSQELLQRIAERFLRERGIDPDFPPEALAEVEAINPSRLPIPPGLKDLRHLPWCSIDNEDTRDLDQLTVAEPLAAGAARVLIAIADVAVLVPQRSAVDRRAQQNTTSVYTVAKVFPMLPEGLSTGLTSLNFASERRAMVAAIEFAADGTVRGCEFHEAIVYNHARLNYDDVAAWLDGEGPAPDGVDAVRGLADNIRLQERIAAKTRALRFTRGALTFETVQARPVFTGGELKDLAPEKPNRAKQMIEDFMIATNQATAGFLADRRYASIRRVVRSPKRWDRIMGLAAERGVMLPVEPDPKALESFLRTAKARAPEEFPELSLSIVKLLGSGEYVLETPEKPGLGHFGLAVRDYAHSTAPNRRFPDLITQRLLKAALHGEPAPYTHEELDGLARHCTEQEDDAKKVERQVAKSAAAMLLEARVGEVFDAVVTGAAPKGTWVRISHPVVEGRLIRGFEGREVGDKLRVQLRHVDVERGFLDFTAAN